MLLSVFLLVSKYPASRHLGLLVLSYLSMLVILALGLQTNLLWISLGLISFVFSVYCNSFFTQNTRISIGRTAPLLIIIVISGLRHLVTSHWLLPIGMSLTIVIQTIETIRVLRGQSKARGFDWFQNPGSRLSWFKYFWLYNLLFIVSLMFAFQHFTIAIFGAGLLILIALIYIQIFKESSFASPIPIGNKYKKSTLTPEIKAAILSKLEAVMETKFYLKDDASLVVLAKALHVSTHHLSQVLNESKGVSFQELIGSYRIREARNLLKDDEYAQSKIETIAALVGYNSKSAFNTAFKKQTGLTPTVYRESKEVRTYREALLPKREIQYIDKNKVGLGSNISLKLNQNIMTNFFKTFFRSLKRNKVFTLINLLGLTLGFICSIFIYMFISNELSFDTEVPNSEAIYRVAFVNENPQTRTPHPLAQAMVRDWPAVESAVSISPWYGAGLTLQSVRIKNEEDNTILEVPDVFFADSTFFNVFDLQFLAGDSNALHHPFTIVITDQMATRFFGEEDPIGKELSLSDTPLVIGAVVKGMPKNAHFHFNVLLSYVTTKQISPESNWYTWEDFGHFNYIKLVDGADATLLESKISNWIVSYLQWSDTDKERLLAGEANFILQPITDIHLCSNLRWELEKNGNIQYIYLLTGTWFFILLIVAINYINLTTAKSLERAKEIGVRKTLGAVSSNMVIQFGMESLLFSMMALLLSFCFVVPLLDSFNFLADKLFHLTDVFNIELMTKALLLSIGIGAVSGFYPALVLSQFNPVEVLKGKFSFSAVGTRIRGLLVVVQFAVSAILIASSFIVLRQIDYMKSKELGFDQHQVISIQMNESAKYGGYHVSEINAMQDNFQTIPGVQHVSGISNLPGGQFNQNRIFITNNPTNGVDAAELYMDFGAEKVLGFDLVAGRYFDHSYAADSAGTNFIVNQSAVRSLNLDHPVGTDISWEAEGGLLNGKIIGVLKDFHYKSLHESIQPLIVRVDRYGLGNLIVKIEGEHFREVMARIKTEYESFESEVPFTAHHLDQQMESLYTGEENTLNIFSLFTAVAIFLACLGLLGMALALLSQKVKEVGIRKILGASIRQIMQMIFLQFAKLIMIALLLGLPLAYVLMQNWMSMFAYQVTMNLVPFVWSAVLLLIVALLSVSIVVAKIAWANPADALRYE